MNERACVIAFLDVSVACPARLTNLLMRPALRGLVRARWSDRIYEQRIAALLRNRPARRSRSRREHACWWAKMSIKRWVR
jgi:hypothetical protein